MTGESIIDVDCCQHAKRGQFVAGDVFLSRKLREEGRVVAVLSDGLGSGVKAAVLANLTATMAMRYAEAFVDPRKSARTIMDTLPICEVRKISYSTFTIVDADAEGQVRIIEHGNPTFALLRDGREIDVPKTSFTLEQWQDRVISLSSFDVREGDRIVMFSDGISQSGMGTSLMPLGWGRDQAVRRALAIVADEPDIASRALALSLADEALANDGKRAKDDISCAIMTIRRPRRLLVITGPPFDRNRDSELADFIRSAPGRKAICGGTTATIVSRLLGEDIAMDLDHHDPNIPPAARMRGVDLITEGFLTLARTVELLEKGQSRRQGPPAPWPNAADQLLSLLLDADIVDFVVGTRINEAHQDPNVPVELDLRRNVVRKLAHLLDSAYLKQTSIRFL